MFTVVTPDDLLFPIGVVGEHSPTAIDLVSDRFDVGFVGLQNRH